MSKWLLVDGFNLAYRCFHALPELTSSRGFPTGALHGWVKSLWKLIDQEHPHATLVFFDLGESEDRVALHAAYKAQRKPMPDALRQQIDPIKALTRAMGLAGIEQQGVESDDLLASEAVALARDGHDVVIVSSDKDFAQIVDDRIRIMLPPPSANPKLGWRLLDAAGVQEKFGVPPAQIAHYLALVGDTSDNIPGLDGVGPKTAAKWLAECGGSVECVVAKAGELKPERFREAVATNAERLRLNLRLTTLNLALPRVAPEWRTPNPPELFRLMDEYEMRSTGVEARRRYAGGAVASMPVPGIGGAHAAASSPTASVAGLAPAPRPAAQKAEQGELF
ncbi:5'-3' exonuclease H3TH domain-containing protein [Opitutus sp. ER46]|uniref:5'-3' exonuclease n=1 Tax=Opitutus sp. ER46 TaxID=2161864 RepID=UPI000D310D63|nr:5'-3' exonuclease H3TH domain-containing protein [Opitutus sp. ER46]PTX98987.1 5'-3' exonuclease [Opitutus sp. ER46]